MPPSGQAILRTAAGLLLAASAWAVDNQLPHLAAAYDGPALDPRLASWDGTITVTGIGAGDGEDWQTVTLVAVPLEPGLLTVQGIDRDPGASTATVRIRLAGPSIAAGSGRILVSAVDDGVPMGVATAIVDVPLVPWNTAPYLYWLEYHRIDPDSSWGYPLSNFQLQGFDLEDDPIVYVVRRLPVHAELLLNDEGGFKRTLQIGDSFSQDQLTARYISVVADPEVDMVPDGFGVDIEGQAGGGPHIVPLWLGTAGPALVVTAADGGLVWREGGGRIAIAGQATVTGSVTDLSGGSLVMAPAGGWRDGDRLALEDQGRGTGQVGIEGGSVLVDGTPLGTLAQDADGTLRVSFTAPAVPLSAARVILRALCYDHSGDDPGEGSRSVLIALADGHGVAAPWANALVRVQPVDDPPTVATARVAVPLECPATVTLLASDPDSPSLAWSLAGVDGGLSAAVLADGRAEITALAGGSGARRLRVRVSDGHQAVEAAVDVVVSGPGDARPHPAGDVPRQAVAGETISFDLPWDVSAFAGGADLVFSADPAAPGGLLVEAAGPQTARITWPVPADEPVRTHRRFMIIARDVAGRGAGRAPVSLWMLARPSGGG